MSLEPAAEPFRLYAATGPDVSVYRPLFSDVEIPGVGHSPAIVIGHPCSFRGRNGQLAERTPVASVEPHQPAPAQQWSNGYFNRMPLPGLPLEGSFHVAWLDRFGLALTSGLTETNRVACLSHAGINQLQQRLVFHQTRLDIPTATFHKAFDHTYEEAELLEDWTTELGSADESVVAAFGL